MSQLRLGSIERPARVAIVGAGPSGFYAAEALLKAEGLQVDVDLFERLPMPYGLVRYGVAPDHQKIKSVTRAYGRVATAFHARLRFFGNVKIGRDLSVDELRRHYDQIIYTFGCESDRRMDVPGEDLAGSYTATAFVAWFNGHPDYRDFTFDLTHKTAVVVGVGNVAMDVTRVLLRDRDELSRSDIADYALAALRESRVEEVILLGRRGAAQAAFSPKEIRELVDLGGVDLCVEPRDLALDEISLAQIEQDADAAKNVAILQDQLERCRCTQPRRIRLKFLTSPVELIGEAGRVTAVKVERNELYRNEGGTIRPRGTGETTVIPAGLVFRSIGYRGVPMPGVPFHESWGIIPNQNGRIVDPESKAVLPNEYVAGWIKRGPTGLIGTNRGDAKETVEMMLADMAANSATADPNKTRKAVDTLIRERRLDVISFDDWAQLDALEVKRGEAVGKVREKFVTMEEIRRSLS